MREKLFKSRSTNHKWISHFEIQITGLTIKIDEECQNYRSCLIAENQSHFMKQYYWYLYSECLHPGMDWNSSSMQCNYAICKNFEIITYVEKYCSIREFMTWKLCVITLCAWKHDLAIISAWKYYLMIQFEIQIVFIEHHWIHLSDLLKKFS